MTRAWTPSLALLLITGLGTTAMGQENLVVTGSVGPLVLPVTEMRAAVVETDSTDVQLAIAMDPEGTLRFAVFTELSQGEIITLSLCGHDILRVAVRVQIESGQALSAPLSAALAQELADVINHGRSCAD